MLTLPMPTNCRACGKFVPAPKKHCSYRCYGKAQRGRCKRDRQSPSKKAYIMIRLPDGSREYLHRHVWRLHNGKEIPEGYIVHHKDENKYNNHPSNLELRREDEHTPGIISSGVVGRRKPPGARRSWNS